MTWGDIAELEDEWDRQHGSCSGATKLLEHPLDIPRSWVAVAAVYDLAADETGTLSPILYESPNEVRGEIDTGFYFEKLKDSIRHNQCSYEPLIEDAFRQLAPVAAGAVGHGSAAANVPTGGTPPNKIQSQGQPRKPSWHPWDKVRELLDRDGEPADRKLFVDDYNRTCKGQKVPGRQDKWPELDLETLGHIIRNRRKAQRKK